VTTDEQQIPLDQQDRLEAAGDLWWFVMLAFTAGVAGIRLGSPGLVVTFYCVAIVIQGVIEITGGISAKDQS
jgi:hypothetical protein